MYCRNSRVYGHYRKVRLEANADQPFTSLTSRGVHNMIAKRLQMPSLLSTNLYGSLAPTRMSSDNAGENCFVQVFTMDEWGLVMKKIWPGQCADSNGILAEIITSRSLCVGEPILDRYNSTIKFLAPPSEI